jgi:hypothetical protein
MEQVEEWSFAKEALWMRAVKVLRRSMSPELDQEILDEALLRARQAFDRTWLTFQIQIPDEDIRVALQTALEPFRTHCARLAAELMFKELRIYELEKRLEVYEEL